MNEFWLAVLGFIPGSLLGGAVALYWLRRDSGRVDEDLRKIVDSLKTTADLARELRDIRECATVCGFTWAQRELESVKERYGLP